MSVPPLHNLRLGKSTGVTLKFSKQKKESDDYEHPDGITSEKLDDFINKEASIKELDELIKNLKDDAPFLMQWRLAICENMTQKLSHYKLIDNNLRSHPQDKHVLPNSHWPALWVY